MQIPEPLPGRTDVTLTGESRIKISLHPNKAGYAVMEPFILSAIDKVLE